MATVKNWLGNLFLVIYCWVTNYPQFSSLTQLYYYLSEPCRSAGGTEPRGMAHLCYLSLVASSLSTKTPPWLAIRAPLRLNVWSWGLQPHWHLGPSALLGMVLRLFWEEIVKTYLYDYNPYRVVFSGTWLNSPGSSELPKSKSRNF